jgi:formylglycine-generating enzyme
MVRTSPVPGGLRSFLSGLLWLTLCGATVDAAEGKKLALLVGVESYRHNELTRLNYCCDDVTTLAGILAKQGFTCRLLADEGFDATARKTSGGPPRPTALPTRANIAEELKKLLEGLTRDDLVLVVFSGHGLQPSGATQPFFCPLDANPTTKTVYVERDGQSLPTQQLVEPHTLVGLGDLLADLKSSGVGRKLVLVDACRDAPTTKGSKGVTTVSLDLLPSSCSLLMSCTDGEQSFESEKLGTGGRGVFLNAVIEGFEGKAVDSKGDVSWGRLVVHVTESVPESMRTLYGESRQQTPHEVKNLSGNVVLAGRSMPLFKTPKPPVSPKRPDPLDATRPCTPSEVKAVQQAWAKALGKPMVERNSVQMDMVLLPPGDFWMGSDETKGSLEKVGITGSFDSTDEAPCHRVRITRPFQLARTEVTVGQFREFVNGTGYETEAERDEQGGKGYNAGTKQREEGKRFSWRNTGWTQSDEHPVVNVSWNDATKFCEWLSAKEGRSYRLPTEAEWEYACRGGTQTHFWAGDSAGAMKGAGNMQDRQIEEKYPSADLRRNPRFPFDDGEPFTARVGQYRSNAFGLADMLGNAAEWCADDYDSAVYRRRTGTSIDPLNSADGPSRVFRGGGWFSQVGECRSASRSANVPWYPGFILGFRLALSPSGS